MRRPIQIAQDIRDDWKNITPYAKPYLNAMLTIYNINDMYGCDTAKNIIRYFLANASIWKGETARRIKKELNEMVK